MKERKKYLTLRQAETALLKPGAFLQKMHTGAQRGLEWFVVPGGPVSDAIAERLLARGDIVSAKNGLFPGVEQTRRRKS